MFKTVKEKPSYAQRLIRRWLFACISACCQESDESIYYSNARLFRKQISLAKPQKSLYRCRCFEFRLSFKCMFLKRWSVSERWAKATQQTYFLPLFFPNNDLCVDPANSSAIQAESGPGGGRGLILWCCQSAVALFAYYSTSIWRSWLLWSCPGVPRRSCALLLILTAHRPCQQWSTLTHERTRIEHSWLKHLFWLKGFLWCYF